MTALKALEWFFYACVNLLPQMALVTIACRDFLRFSLKKTVILSMGVLLWYWFFLVASEVNWVSYMALNFILNGGYVAFGILLTKGKPWQFLFALAMVLNYGSVCAIISGGIFSALGMAEMMYCWQDSLLTLVIAAGFWFLYDWLLVGKLRPLFVREDADGIWKYLWLVPGLFCAIHYFLIWTYGGLFSTNLGNVIFLVVVNTGSTFVSYLVAKMVDERMQLMRLETENQRLAMQTAQYESLKGRMEETRQARHDLRQHLRLMQAYVDGENISALREYLNAYGQSLPADTSIRYCQNTVADTVVRYYAELAQAQGVSFTARLELPDELSLPEPDLCVLLGNLLENALDSCKKHLDASPYIHMGGKLMGARMLTIFVDNCPADEPKRERGALLSSKRTSMGTGTASVRAIAERYGGEARFEWKENIFSASVVLTLPEGKME